MLLVFEIRSKYFCFVIIHLVTFFSHSQLESPPEIALIVIYCLLCIPQCAKLRPRPHEDDCKRKR